MYFAAVMESVDIILPAYNPLPGWEDNVIARFKSLQDQLPSFGLNLIIVNDGSSKMDEALCLPKLQAGIKNFLWVSYPVNRGKGFALREGVKLSESDLIVYTDIDWPYEESSMTGLITKMSSGSDVVIGIRNEEYYTHLPPARRRISRMLRKFNAALLRLKVDDTQAGLKGFRKELKSDFLSTTIDRYLFDLEFIYRISRQKEITIIGYPISLREGITFSTMNRKILMQEARNFLRIWLRS